MIPLALLQAAWASPVLRKVLGALVVAVALVVAFTTYTVHVEHKAVAAYQAKEQIAAAREHDRRLEVLNKVQAQADRDVTEIATLQIKNEKLQRDIARLSAAHDHQPCLDAGSVQRLRSIGRPGH